MPAIWFFYNFLLFCTILAKVIAGGTLEPLLSNEPPLDAPHNYDTSPQNNGRPTDAPTADGRPTDTQPRVGEEYYPEGSTNMEYGEAQFTTLVPPGYEGDINQYNEDTFKVVIQDVLNNLDTEIVPKKNFSEPLELKISFDLLSLASFDEISGEISLVASLKLQWSAETTPRWNPTYMSAGKESVTISASDVWRPQLFVLNPSKKVQDLTSNLNRLRLGFDGSVEWSIVTIIEAACSIDVTFFPFDTQTCSVFIAPWGYDNSELHIAGFKAETHEYLSQSHNSWDLVDVKASGINNEKTAYLNVTVVFKRHSDFFLINILLPPTLLSLVNPCVFLLPAASGERMSFAVTCFLAFSVFLTLLGDNMPKSATPISHLSFFLVFMLIHSCCITLVTIISLKVYHKDGISPVPKWLQVFVRLVRFRYCRGDICRRKTRSVDNNNAGDKTEVEHIGEKKLELDMTDQTRGSIDDLPHDDMEDQPNHAITWFLVGKTFDYFFFCMFLGWLLFSLITTLMTISLL